MIGAEDVVSICQGLSADGIRVWLSGGWGIDALLRAQTRPHKDLDVIMLLDDVVRMRELLGRYGFSLKDLWSENAPAVDSLGVETPTAFVLRDPDGREVDVHALRPDGRGGGTPAWADGEGLVFGAEDLAGEGMITGLAVRCLSAKMQVRCHTGYKLPDAQLRDLGLLCERFGVEPPGELPCPGRRPS